MTIKMKFHYSRAPDSSTACSCNSELWMARNINDLPVGEPHPFYMLSGALSDFPEYNPTFADAVLEQVERIERGEIDAYEYEGQGFTQHITRDRVRFEHTIFSECPEWPIWYCTLAQYKTALKGYRQFLDMPKSIESKLIIELPEDESGIA